MSADMTTRLGWVRDLHLLAMRTPAAFAVSCTMGLMAPAALATPDGGTFVTNPEFGQILQFGPDGQTVTNVFLPGTAIDPSNRHLINWTSLDLGAQETLNFSGADGYSVMNRITTLGSATSINGMLNAMTGNVTIVNSAGVVFGQNAIINAAGLHAAAANWSEGDQLQTDFLAGAPLTFNTTGDVEFHGILNASDGIALLGQHVQNTGEINGRYIVMAAGDRIVVEDLGSRFSVVIDGQSMDDLAGAPAAGTVIADLTTGNPAIHNSGTITTADGGNVSLLAGDLLGLAILHDGEIHSEGGDVDLLASGGAIWTNTDNVNVANAGLIDVSDDDQAGTVQMSAAAIVLEASTQANGHDGAISIQASSNVVLAGGGVVVADGGIAAADGGEILIRATDGTVWAEAGTELSAKGGLFGGDGGRIEVSGQTIAVLAATKLGAVSGEAGQLFINSEGPLTIDASGDPLVAVDQTDLSSSILAAGATGRLGAASGETLSSVDGHLSVSSGEPLRVETSLLDLRETAILTSDEIQLAIGDAEQSIHATSLTLNGNVVLEQSVTLGSDDTLALRGGGVSGDETTALVLSSEGVVELEGDLGSADSQLGNIDVLTGHTISLLGGSTEAGQYIHTSGNLNIGGAVQDGGGAVSVSASEAVIVRAGGNISLGVDGSSDLSIEVADNVDIEAGGTFTNMSEFVIEGSLRFAGGDVVNIADLAAGQGITMQALTGTLDTVGALNTVMDINLAAADTLTNETSLTSEQGSVRLESYQSDVISLATLSAADTVSLRADNGLVSSASDVQATDVTMTAGGGITIDGSVTGTSTLTAVAATGNITTSGGGLLQGNALTLEATTGSVDATSSLSGQTIAVSAANDLTITGSITGEPAAATGTGGNVTLTANTGGLTVAGDLAGSAITMTATAGDVSYAGNAAASGVLALSGETVTVSSGSLSGSGVTATASGAVDIAADIQAGGDVMLTSIGAGVSYAGTLASDGSVLLRGSDIDSTAGISADQGITMQALTGDLISVGTLETAGDTVSLIASTGSVSSTGDVQATDVAMTAGGGITIDGSVTGTSTLTAVAATGNITTSGNGLLHGNSLSLDATAGSIDVTSNLSGQTVSVTAANGLAIAGSVTAQPAGATGTGGDVTLTASTGDVRLTGELSGAAITMTATAGEVTYAGNASASGDLTMSGDAVTVTSGSLSGSNVLVTSTSAASITADVNATGNLIVTSVADAVSYEGTADIDGQITLNAETTVTLEGQLTGTSLSATAAQGDLFQSGSVVATGDVSLTAAAGNATLSGDVTGSSVVAAAFGDVTQAGTINSAGVVLITSEQGGTITIDGTVTAGGSLDVRAENDGVIAIGGQLTGDAVLLEASTMQLTGADVRSTGGDLHILADQTIFSGNASLESGEDLVLAASAGAGQVRIDDASVSLTAAGDVNLLSTVDGSGGMLTASAGDMLLIGGDIGATEEVESLDFTADRLVLGGLLDGVDWTVGQVNARGDIGLNTVPLDTLSDLPTIYGYGPSLAITSRQGDVQIGANHGLSYLGDVLLDAGGTLTVGDITTLGDLTLRGNTVAVHRRAEGVLTEPFGPVNSEQTSVIAGGTLRIEGDLQYIGDTDTGAAPRFAAVGDAFGVPVLQRGLTDAFDASDIVVASADGDRPALRWLLPRIDVRDDGVIAAESKLGEAVVSLPKGNEEIRTLEVLADLGIELIDSAQVGLRADQVAAASHLVNDIGHRGGSMVDPTSGLVKISRSRLNDRFVRAAVTDYAAAIEWAPEAGSTESAGQSIELARLEWEAEPGEKSDYRQWLAEGGSPVRERAARILADLDAVFRDLRLAGLTRAEVAASRRFVRARLGGGEI